MRYHAIIAALLVAVGAQAAEYHIETVQIQGTTNAAAAITSTVTVVTAPLVQMHVVLGTATNVDVDITVEPDDTSEGSFTLYSADDVDADKVLYPVFDRHGSDGSALTSDPPAPHVVSDPVQIVISDFATTGATVNVKLIWKTE